MWSPAPMSSAAPVACHGNAEHSRHAPVGRAGTGQARPLRGRSSSRQVVGATLVVARADVQRGAGGLPRECGAFSTRARRARRDGTSPSPARAVEFAPSRRGDPCGRPRRCPARRPVACHGNAEHSRHAPVGRVGTGQARPLRPLFPARRHPGPVPYAIRARNRRASLGPAPSSSCLKKANPRDAPEAFARSAQYESASLS